MRASNYRRLSEETIDGVVEMYVAGDRLRDIEERYGIARSSIYWCLTARDIEPNRTRVPAGDRYPSTSGPEEIARSMRLTAEYIELLEHRVVVLESAFLDAADAAIRTAAMPVEADAWGAVADAFRKAREDVLTSDD